MKHQTQNLKQPKSSFWGLGRLKLSAIQIEQIAPRTAELLSEKIYYPHPQPLSKGDGSSDDLLTQKEL